jgi:hypothetical protein
MKQLLNLQKLMTQSGRWTMKEERRIPAQKIYTMKI